MVTHLRVTHSFPFVRTVRLICLAIVLAVLGMGECIHAQDKPQLLIGYTSANKDAEPASRLTVRPNVEQPVYFFVKNPSGKEGKFAAVVAGVRGEVTFAKDEKIKPVPFAKPTPPPPPPGTPPVPAKPAWVDVEGTPVKISVQLLQDGVAEPIETKELAVGLYLPNSYVNVSQPSYDGAKKDLSVVVSAKKFDGPPCTVQLVLLPGPGRIPGLKTPLSSDADLQGVLSKEGDKTKLYARGLSISGSDTMGQFYLTVDGYQHAKVYDINFAATDKPITAREGAESYRIVADDVAAAGAKIPVRIEVDESQDPDAALELSLGQLVDGNFQKKFITLLQGSRERKTRLSPGGPGGSLIVQTEVKDWVTEVDTAGATGKRLLRVARLDADRKEVEATVKTKEIVLDGSPPEEVQFRDPPATAFQGAVVAFKATGKDLEGIQGVVFFIGKPPADGKLPPTLDTYPATKDDKGVYSAKVPMPVDKKGPTIVSVQFVNLAGMATAASTTVTVLDPFAPPPPPLPGKIEGKLLEGDRPQAKLDVTLLDDKGAEKGKTKTKGDGTFVFENVVPGKYKVTAAKIASVTKAAQDVEVKSGETATVEAKLFR